MRRKMAKVFLSIVLIGIMLVGASAGNQVKAAVGDTLAQNFLDPNMAQAVADQIAGGNTNAIIDTSMISTTTSLNLSDKNINSIEGVDVFTNLKRLYIAGNQLTSLPANIGDLTKLERMDAGRNQLTDVPNSLGDLSNLVYLNLRANDLGVFPDVVLNLTSLTDLYLDNTQLTEVPDAIGDLSDLVFLDLSGNELTRIPDVVGNLDDLFFLDLSGNKLDALPDSIGNLRDLNYLGLASNYLTSLPDSFVNLNSLIVCMIEDNHLMDLSATQYSFITSIASNVVHKQNYSEIIGQQGYSNENFSFDALPAQEQFLNYGLTYSYRLVKPDNQTLSVVPNITNGVITIDSIYLDLEGQYTLISDGSGGVLSPVHYEQLFTIAKRDILVTAQPGTATVSYESAGVKSSTVLKMPKTGSMVLYLATGVNLLGGITLLGFEIKKRK